MYSYCIRLLVSCQEVFMFDNNILAERLHLLRTQANISQKVLAEGIGVSYHAISKIENKQRAASIEVIFAMSEYFNVSLDYLTGRTDNPDISNNNKPELLNDRFGLIKDESDNSYISNTDNALTTSTYKEKELLENFRLLNNLEQNVILGKVSEIIYDNKLDKKEVEISEELVSINKSRFNK